MSSEQRKHINFTIVPDETGARERVYTNFCAVSHTPFDFTLTFCEVLPPTEQDLRQAQTDRCSAHRSGRAWRFRCS